MITIKAGVTYVDKFAGEAEVLSVYPIANDFFEVEYYHSDGGQYSMRLDHFKQHVLCEK
jgi:hypothetical protein